MIRRVWRYKYGSNFLMLSLSVLFNTPGARSLRLCRLFLHVNLWLSRVCLTRALPLLVNLMRLAAPRLVFSFGISLPVEQISARRQQHRHVSSFHPRAAFGLRHVGY